VYVRSQKCDFFLDVENSQRKIEEDHVIPGEMTFRFISRAKLTTIISEAVTRGRPVFPAVFFHQREIDNSSKETRESARLSTRVVYLNRGYFESSPLVRK